MAETVNLFTITSFFSETPERVQKGLNSLHSNRVVSVAVLPGGIIKGSVQASQKKKVYKVEVHVEGQSVSRTDMKCAWKRAKTPSTDQIAAKRVSEMAPSTT